MIYFAKLAGMALVVFLVIDALWLGVIAKNLYKHYLGDLMATNVRFGAALLFYLLFVCGMVFFVIEPALAKNSIQFAIFAGAFLGLLCYATYDLTNLATLKDWPVFVTVIDLAWGAFITATTSSIVFSLAKLWGIS
ncbi:DUF2177 family protein [Paenilisteria rocourtiae]|uniref:Putative membrane protein n=1 Tax=Listeria rocourtiae TaxID=647910 RepID=A0A4R6ZSG4_9LIST|nr:DUF2177 family protein [Listeria rocourtiae]EUJ48076.1 hypothetical protein PROCOU_06233 [Listeria rocourtiae FSL F6-920]MBC1603219.1 DUF2177 family protein [Listeria rocourtiae]TDR55498.1 putative membrane protein [Listeria rocourtiae]